jgi:hypothetical protein
MSDIASLISKNKPVAPSKFIVMGDPMTGKTTLASKAPKPLFLSTDGNAAKAGLHAIDATDRQVLLEAITFFASSDEYETLVIDTIEGIADMFEKVVIEQWNQETGQQATALTDVPYGKLTGQFNKRMAAFSETLWSLPKNVIVLTYTKRQVDDVSGSIILASELKSIRQFTRFADGLILTSFDGEKYRAHVVSKRTVMAGNVEYGDIEPFLRAAGWELPSKKVKVGQARK